MSSLVLISGLALLPPAFAAAAASGTFNVLTMNVAGIPEILNDNGEGDKTTNTMLIGEAFNAYEYNVIHVQEDFNYHATLYEYDEHPYRTATSGGVLIGSGLNTLSDYDWIDFVRTKWATCSDASENDCLTPKGFTSMRLRLDEGVYLDFYNLHADAGVEDGDETARNANIQQVADYIETNSIGNAVLVYGDTNSRYTRSLDTGIRVLSESSYNLTDAWLELVMGGKAPTAGADALLCESQLTTNLSCEVVDKIFYRSSAAVDLSATSFHYDQSRFLNSTGGPLSDHIPVRVEFSYALSSSLRLSDLSGGPHGDWFNDLSSVPKSPKTASVTLAGGSRLDSVSLKLSTGTTFTHGGTGGTASTLTLASGEYVNKIATCTGQYNSHTRNFWMQITTNTGRTLQAGTTTSTCYNQTAPTGMGLVGWYGRSGDEVDLVGAIWGSQ